MTTRAQEEAEKARVEEEKAEEFRREWDAMDPEERTKKAVEQNKQIQERIRQQVEQENEEKLQAQRDAVGKEVTSTRGMTFKEAAEATEKLNQPPNFSSGKERAPATRAPVTGTPPPQTETLPRSAPKR